MTPILAELDRWLAPIGGALAHSLWQGALVAFAAWAAMTLARSPRVRYAIGCGAMLLMLACPIATVARLGPDAPRPTFAPAAPAIAGLIPRVAGEPARREARSRLATPALATPAPTFRDRLAALAPSLVVPWLIGVAVVAAFHLVGVARVSRLRRAAVPIDDAAWRARVERLSSRLGLRRAVALCATTRLDCPAVVGALRPMILWPAAALTGLSPAQVDALLAHELAHVRRHDYLVNLLQACVETLLFFHPAVWWLGRRVRAEREHCCDDLAAAAIGGDRVAYAGALAAMESLRAAPPFAMAANGGPLVTRVQRLVHPTPAAGWLAVGLQLITLALVILLLVIGARRDGGAKAAADVAARATTSPTTRPDYRLAPDDLIRVHIADLSSTGLNDASLRRVSGGGQISLPYLRDPMQAAGRTEIELERQIILAYADAQILTNASVSVLAVQRADGVNVPPALLATPAPAAAREPAPEVAKPPAAIPDAIAARDLLRLVVQDLSGAGVSSVLIKRVAADGTITLPYVSKPLKLAGLTSAQAEREVSRAFQAAQVLTNANVDVLVLQLADGRAIVPAGVLGDVPAAAAVADEVEQRAQQQRLDALAAEVERLKRDAAAPASTPTPAPTSMTPWEQAFLPTPATTPTTAPASRPAPRVAVPSATRALASRDPGLAKLLAARDDAVPEYVARRAGEGENAAGVRALREKIEVLDAAIDEYAEAILSGRSEADLARDDAGFRQLIVKRDMLAADLIFSQQANGVGSPTVIKKRQSLDFTERQIAARMAELRAPPIARTTPAVPGPATRAADPGGAVGTVDGIAPAATQPVTRTAASTRDLAPRDLELTQLLVRRDRLDTPLRVVPPRPEAIAAMRDAIEDQIALRAARIERGDVADDDASRQFLELQASREGATPERRAAIDARLAGLVHGPGEYYVGGHVERPGVYSLGRAVTLRQALAAAGVVDPPALPRDAAGDTWIDVIVRDAPAAGGPPVAEATLRVALADVVAGRHDDFVMMPDDRVSVGVNVPEPVAAAAAPPALRIEASGDRVRLTTDGGQVEAKSVTIAPATHDVVGERTQQRPDAPTAAVDRDAAATKPASPAPATRTAAEAEAAAEPVIARMLQTRDDIDAELSRLRQVYGRGAPIVVKLEANRRALDEQIAAQVAVVTRAAKR